MKSRLIGCHRAVSSVIVVTAACILAPTLLAGSDDHWSANIGVGYAFPYDSDYETGTDRLDGDFGAYLGVGYKLRRFSFGIELAYLTNDAYEFESSDGGGVEPSSGVFTHTALMLNAGNYWRPRKTWRPYACIGLGASSFSINDLTDRDGDFVIDGSETVLAIQVLAGVAYHPAGPAEVEFGYRLFWSDEAEVTGITQSGNSFVNTSGPVLIQSVNLGARFYF